MDYSKLSNLEINSAVSMAMVRKSVKPESKYVVINDYCNNPADAWPIITENRISIVWDCAEDASAEWWNAFDQFDDCRVQYQSNPLRAAMIVFIMMQENK